MQAAIPQKHPRGRPASRRFLASFLLRDDSPVRVRVIEPGDEIRLAQFHKTLSEQSVYFRYFSMLPLEQRLAHRRLQRICASDPQHDFVLIADARSRPRSRLEIAAVARLSKLVGQKSAEFALLVGDQWQGLGLGSRLLKLLIESGRTAGLETIVGHVLPENHQMQHLCRKAGFELHHKLGEPEVLAELHLDAESLPRPAPRRSRGTKPAA